MSKIIKKRRVTAPWVQRQKGVQRVTMLTVYDFPMATILDEAGVDILLVGDSVATVNYGEEDTLSVTMDDMIRHAKSVSRAAKRALVIGDMPFMSYQADVSRAVENAGRFLKEGGAHGVKLEGGVEVRETIRAIVRAGIPVVAHIGLTPQSVHSMGGYRIQGRSLEEQDRLIEAAKAVQEAGAFCVVLECVEEKLASRVTQLLSIPTIGIGSGEVCDGEVLVTHDLVGLTSGRVPSFVKPLANLKEPLREAAIQYVERTRKGAKPAFEGKSEVQDRKKEGQQAEEPPRYSFECGVHSDGGVKLVRL